MSTYRVGGKGGTAGVEEESRGQRDGEELEREGRERRSYEMVKEEKGKGERVCGKEGGRGHLNR